MSQFLRNVAQLSLEIRRNERKRAVVIFFEQKTVLPYQLSKNESKVSLKREKKEKEKGGLFFFIFFLFFFFSRAKTALLFSRPFQTKKRI